MKYNILLTQIAAQYDCGAYGTSTYNNSQVCGTSTTAATGPLSNTGFDVVAPLAGGALLMVAAVVLFVRNARRNKQLASHQR